MDLDTILEEGGVTRFHWKAIFITGAAWAVLPLLITIVGFTFPDMAKAWKLSNLMLGWIGSAALVGLFAGIFLASKIANRIGRKPLFQGALLWSSLLTISTAFALRPVALLVLRFLTGLGLGGLLVVTPVLMSEYLPPRHREKFMFLFDLFWPAGFLLAASVSLYPFDTSLQRFRLLFLFCGIFALLIFFTGFLIPETPQYSMKSGKIDQAKRTLRQITKMNDISMPRLGFDRPEERASASLKVSTFWESDSGWRIITVATIAWVVQNLTYYVLFLWLPMILYGIDVFRTSALYPVILVFALAQFPGQIIGTWLAESWNSRWTFVGCLVLEGIALFSLRASRSFASFTIALIVAGIFNLAAWGSLYPYTSELFPPQFRAAGSEIAQVFGKVAAVVAPISFGYAWDASGNTFLGLNMMAGAVILVALAIAITGRPEASQ